MGWIYRVGLSTSEVSEEALRKSGFQFSVVSPHERFVFSAKGVLGKSYKRGASVLKDAPNLFDCSSLVAWAAVEAGLAIPRITIDQFVFSERISKDDLKQGDLVFANTGERLHTEGTYFSQVLGKEVKEEPIRTETLEYNPGTKVPGGVDHVGIYIDGGKVIHATIKKGFVVEENLDESNLFKNIVGYGRVVDSLDAERYVVEIPESRPELRNRELLIEEIQKYQRHEA